MSIQFAENGKKDQRLNVICQDCQRETNHIVVASIEAKRYEKLPKTGDEFYSDSSHQIIKCQGCDTLSFRVTYEDSDSVDTEMPVVETLYPKRTLNELGYKNFQRIPPNIRRIYKETVDCYNNGTLTLCAAGLRALVEAICFETKVTYGMVDKIDKNGKIIGQKKSFNLYGKINGLFQKKILTEANAKALHEHRFLGNEVLHEMKVPNSETLRNAIDIIEDTLVTIYEVPSKSAQMRFNRGII